MAGFAGATPLHDEGTFAMPAETNEVITGAVSSAKDTVKALEAEEARLRDELATVRGQRKAATKFLDALTGSAPRRRRRRTNTPAE